MGYCDYERERKDLQEEQKIINQKLAEKKKREERINEISRKELMKSLGYSIADARKISRMSLQNVAKRIGLKPEDLEEIEQGKRDITILNLIDLGIIFEKSFTEFMEVTAFSFMVRMQRKSTKGEI